MSNLRRMLMTSGGLTYPNIDNNLTLVKSTNAIDRVLPISGSNQILWFDHGGGRNFAILDNSGTEVREHQFLGSAYIAHGIPSEYDGYVYYVASKATADDGNVFVKMDPSDGTSVWESQHDIDGLTDGVRETDHAVHASSAGVAFVLNENSAISYLSFFDLDGAHQFTRKFTLPTSTTHTDVLVTDDSIYVAFYSSSGTPRLWKFNTSGAEQWDIKYTGLQTNDCHPCLQWYNNKLYYGVAHGDTGQGGANILEIDPSDGSVDSQGKLYPANSSVRPDTQSDGSRASQKWMVVDNIGITCIFTGGDQTDAPAVICQCDHSFTTVNWSRDLTKSGLDLEGLSIYRIQSGYIYSGFRYNVTPQVTWSETCDFNGVSNNNTTYTDNVFSVATITAPTEAPEADTTVTTPSVSVVAAPNTTGSSATTSITIGTTW